MSSAPGSIWDRLREPRLLTTARSLPNEVAGVRIVNARYDYTANMLLIPLPHTTSQQFGSI